MPVGVYKHKPNQGFQKGNNLGKLHKGIERSETTKEKLSISHKGKKFSELTKKKMSIKGMGSKNPFWKGGITKNMEYRKRQRKEWRLKNRSRVSCSHLKRRAIKLNAIGSHAFGEWELLKKQYGFTCPCCYRKEPDIKLTEDHIIPLSKGGSNFIENIQPLCRNCNSKKHTKIIKYEEKTNVYIPT